jgi:hypothetical protein
MPPDRRRRRGVLRRLTLSHGGRTFLDRWGIVTRWGGFYLHHIAGPDPGMDVHDHPWAFVSLVLRGGYDEEYIGTHEAVAAAWCAERWPETCTPGVARCHRWLSVHRVPLNVAHRIIAVQPGTWTLVLRGPDRRVWGFYPPSGRIEWDRYEYATRRPLVVENTR